MYTKTFLFILLGVAISMLPLLSYSQACDSVKPKDFPAKDLPTAAERVQLRGEESCKYYYGIGAPKDYVKARKLAFIEWEAADNYGPFEGPGIILMLYANGYGVKRNLDLCIRLACANIGGAPAEVEYRVQHLKKMKANISKEVFDVCDDATSGYMSGWCQSIEFEWGTVTQENIKATQREWIGYRDAWVRFGAVRCPKISAVSWKMMITLDRIEQLKEFAYD